jgi:hypothetical protein
MFNTCSYKKSLKINLSCYTWFTNTFLDIFHISVALMLIYCHSNSFAAHLLALKLPRHTESRDMHISVNVICDAMSQIIATSLNSGILKCVDWAGLFQTIETVIGQYGAIVE